MAADYDPTKHAEVQQGTALRYVSAFIASAAAMYAAYALAMTRPPLVQLIAVLAGTMMFALITQAALFFGLDMSRAQIWKSISLVLAIPLFIVTVGFTVWAFSSLYSRTMPDPSIMSSMAM
jgi:cytochrome o ubiquinol oxidase operon protein cyoD